MRVSRVTPCRPDWAGVCLPLLTSAPLSQRYSTISCVPNAAAQFSSVWPTSSMKFTSTPGGPEKRLVSIRGASTTAESSRYSVYRVDLVHALHSARRIQNDEITDNNGDGRVMGSWGTERAKLFHTQT